LRIVIVGYPKKKADDREKHELEDPVTQRFLRDFTSSEERKEDIENAVLFYKLRELGYGFDENGNLIEVSEGSEHDEHRRRMSEVCARAYEKVQIL